MAKHFFTILSLFSLSLHISENVKTNKGMRFHLGYDDLSIGIALRGVCGTSPYTPPPYIVNQYFTEGDTLSASDHSAGGLLVLALSGVCYAGAKRVKRLKLKD